MFVKVLIELTGIVVGASAGLVAKSVIKAAKPENLSAIKKLGYIIGTSAIAGMVGAQTSEYVTGQIESGLEEGKKILNDVEAIKKGGKTDE